MMRAGDLESMPVPQSSVAGTWLSGHLRATW